MDLKDILDALPRPVFWLLVALIVTGALLGLLVSIVKTVKAVTGLWGDYKTWLSTLIQTEAYGVELRLRDMAAEDRLAHERRAQAISDRLGEDNRMLELRHLENAGKLASINSHLEALNGAVAKNTLKVDDAHDRMTKHEGWHEGREPPHNNS